MDIAKRDDKLLESKQNNNTWIGLKGCSVNGSTRPLAVVLKMG